MLLSNRLWNPTEFILARLASCLQRLLNPEGERDPAYSLVLHSSPCGTNSEVRYHWHIELRVRFPLGEGFERGTGFL